MRFLVLAFSAFSFLICLFPVALAQTTPSPPPPVVPPTPSATAEYYFTVENATFPNLCGKTVLTVNGSYPGPEIRVQRGQKLRVHVFNNGSYGITIHWHGVKQPRNPWFDGPEYVTQCPIQPGKSFTYEVILSDEIGTLWWHAHSDWSRGTVHGAFIILPPPNEMQDSPFQYPNHTLAFATWYNEDLKEISDNIQTATPDDPSGFTINGYPGDQISTNAAECLVAETYNISVVPGQTYLLRLVNAALDEAQYFGIRNHTLTVVARDGALVKPFSTPYVLIFPGQTMDVTFKTDQNAGQYYMAFQNFEDDSEHTTGLVKYPNVTVQDTTFPEFPSGDNATNEAIKFTRNIRNFSNNTKVPQDKDITKRFSLTENGFARINCTGSPDCPDTGVILGATINGVAFALPKTTSILQAYNESTPGVYETDYPQNVTNPAINATKVIELNYGDVVEIVYQSTGHHPLHLHGYSFFEVGVGNATDSITYNLEDPPEVNTASVFANGWTAVRFNATNPGVWFTHCHFERHATRGMSTVLIVKDGTADGEKMIVPADPNIMPTCGEN